MMEPRRFFPAVAIGGAATGVAIAIPVLGDFLRCCFCVGVMAGSAASMKLWLDTHQAENLTPVDGLALGACSGVVVAAVNWIISLPVRLAFGDGLAAFYDGWSLLPDIARSNLHALYTPSAVMVVLSLPLEAVLYAMMGGVGGFVALETVFKDRKVEE